MALSQELCLNSRHVNWISNENKPEFLYSESQRLALEALVDGGREAFARVLEEEGLWQFLSEEEIRRICTTIGQNGANGGDHLIGEGMPGGADSRSLTYWPEESDDMAPGRLDLGWPDKEGYRGVTRAAVYTQPPADFNPSIKETVRRLIRNAQTLIAIAMDRFTDVEILRDVAMVAWRSNIPAYVILDEAHVSAFTEACEACNLHMGVLKNMRVRSVAGGSFQTRSGKILRGPTSQKFMMIDGDKALCGSYSFTWTASRLERNIVTVLTGQVVENFDKEFRVLYAASRPVVMERLKLAPEPSRPNNPTRAPSPLPSGKTQESTCSLRHPKYALVRSGSPFSRKLIAHREKEDGDETHGEGKEKESDDYVQKTGDHQKEDEKENHDLLLHVPKRIGESRAASDGAVKGSSQGARNGEMSASSPDSLQDSRQWKREQFLRRSSKPLIITTGSEGEIDSSTGHNSAHTNINKSPSDKVAHQTTNTKKTSAFISKPLLIDELRGYAQKLGKRQPRIRLQRDVWPLSRQWPCGGQRWLMDGTYGMCRPERDLSLASSSSLTDRSCSMLRICGLSRKDSIEPKHPNRTQIISAAALYRDWLHRRDSSSRCGSPCPGTPRPHDFYTTTSSRRGHLDNGCPIRGECACFHQPRRLPQRRWSHHGHLGETCRLPTFQEHPTC